MDVELFCGLQPVLLGGANIRVSGGIDGFLQLADASQYAVAMTPNAKVCPSEALKIMPNHLFGFPSALTGT